jgi:hypothetical protein
MRKFVTWAVAVAALAATAFALPSHAYGVVTDRDRAVPHYDHIIVILEENRQRETILDHGLAPNIARLAKSYGVATQMYAETHPSEPNYVALIGGDTFGIQDDDAWYCVPGSARQYCRNANSSGYVAHQVDAPHLGLQVNAKGLVWRAYLEDIPAPGSDAIYSAATATQPFALYASKHTPFNNFRSMNADQNHAKELVGFDALHSDLRSAGFPAFALVVPNECHDMHGLLAGPNVPADCADDEGLIHRGDAHLAALVAEIQNSPIWTAPGINTAIIVTWDEDEGAPLWCCGKDAHNPGGGHIPTIVIANHGPRGLADPTPYNHYSLLRTIEDALDLDGHLGHAGDATVLPMTPLFARGR